MDFSGSGPTALWFQAGGGAILSFAAAILVAALVFAVVWILAGRRVEVFARNPVASGDAPALVETRLPTEDLDRLDRSQPLAVLFVGGGHHLEVQSLRTFRDVYSRQYSQILFVSVGLIDYAWMDSERRDSLHSGGSADLKPLLQATRNALDPVIAAAHEMGLKADCRVAVSVDETAELERLAIEVARLYSRSIFFLSKAVWRRKSWVHRLLHAETADVLRGRLEGRGLPVTVLPVVVPASV
jgi:hypothetical protein